jgi:2'-5' RNA ligase
MMDTDRHGAQWSGARSTNGRTGRLPKQYSLPGFGPAPEPTNRLFFAIVPDADAAARIARLAWHLRSEHGLAGELLAEKRLHVTLYPLGDYVGLPLRFIAAAGEAAAAIASQSFEIRFDRAMSFRGRRGGHPFVLHGGDGAAAVTAFQLTLSKAMENAGLGRTTATSHYTPHLTLLYDDRPVADQGVATVSWTAHEFVLVLSLLGRKRHLLLGRWPLLP